jgi:hypothetical protein
MLTNMTSEPRATSHKLVVEPLFLHQRLARGSPPIHPTRETTHLNLHLQSSHETSAAFSQLEISLTSTSSAILHSFYFIHHQHQPLRSLALIFTDQFVKLQFACHLIAFRPPRDKSSYLIQERIRPLALDIP